MLLDSCGGIFFIFLSLMCAEVEDGGRGLVLMNLVGVGAATRMERCGEER